MAHNMSRMSSSTDFMPSSEVTSQQWLDQGIRQRSGYITVWYCCDCGNGPMLLSDSCSGSGCSHYRCDDCSEEEIEENPDDYILQAALNAVLQKSAQQLDSRPDSQPDQEEPPQESLTRFVPTCCTRAFSTSKSN